ncbi:hypothetical protein NLJ89_g9954 [Agrocybe chaxingu]|uniref:Uncharacterized protein n=1 Tax=Agrocybe chaxingu TaxID=84603 RepID=A0A9W8MSK6_9AGAR|nr:hypothetical protein NLJ89_g9954 [Agrocybe chaxingu]
MCLQQRLPSASLCRLYIYSSAPEDDTPYAGVFLSDVEHLTFPNLTSPILSAGGPSSLTDADLMKIVAA